MSRRGYALKRIDIHSGRGLELGPLYSPIVAKDEAQVWYVDHMSAGDLRDKYKDNDIPAEDLASIVEVDYVLGDKSLKDTLQGEQFDYVIACHVIEHIPDMVRWLADVASVLKEGGVLSLVVPDKRFTFDVLRNESRPADVIGAYLDEHRRASSAAMYDFMIEWRDRVDSVAAWQNPKADYQQHPKNSLSKAYQTCLENIKPGNYVDSHCFVFTPYSFFDIVRSLIKHDLFDYEVAYFQPTQAGQLEFYVSLRKAANSPRARKLRSVPRLTRPSALETVEAELARAREELHMVTHSKSWQITKPLRAVLSAAKKLSGRAAADELPSA